MFEDVIEDNLTTRKNAFAITLFIGGETGGSTGEFSALVAPGMKISMPTCHLEIPTHSFDDIISTEINFHALPSTVDGTNEISAIDFVGA